MACRNVRARSRSPASIGSNQLSKRCSAVSISDCGRQHIVLAPSGSDRFLDRLGGTWPSVEVSETDKEIKVTAELPGLDDKDVQVELTNGVLAISGERKT